MKRLVISQSLAQNFVIRYVGEKDKSMQIIITTHTKKRILVKLIRFGS